MLEKIKANVSYILCAFLGLFHFVMMAFNYVAAFAKYEGKYEADGLFNGYQMMKFADLKGSEAGALAVFCRFC